MNVLLNNIYPFVVFPATALLLSLLLTRICIKVLPVLGFVDQPKDKHIHDKPVPTAGGIAIVISFVLPVAVFLFEGGVLCRFIHVIDAGLFVKILLPIAVLVIVGLMDDKYSVPFRYRFIVQLGIGVYCWYIGVAFTNFWGFTLPWFVSLTLTVLWIVFFINVYNLIDGLDGLSGGLGVFSALSLGAFFLLSGHYNATVILFCFAASCSGYLRYNFHPAKIFMGDTGSMLLGFIFAMFGILFSANIETISIVLIPILACGVPVLDGVLVVWRRLGNKILSKFAPEYVYGSMGIADRDVNHVHHRILRKYGNCKKAVLVLYFLAVVLSASDFFLMIFDSIMGISALAVIAAVILLVVDWIATFEIRNTILIVKNLPENIKVLANNVYVQFVSLFLVAIVSIIGYSFLNEILFHSDYAKAFFSVTATSTVMAFVLCSMIAAAYIHKQKLMQKVESF